MKETNLKYTCPYCLSYISITLDNCPYCGAPQRELNQKPFAYNRMYRMFYTTGEPKEFEWQDTGFEADDLS